jgi:hypothetical protein
MAKANGVLSTQPTNTSVPSPQSSRRSFLAQAAIAASGGAALGAGLPLPTAQRSDGETDPMFAAIEDHRRAVATFGKAVDTETALEVSLPADRRRSRISAWEETIVEGDDPRWLASERVRRAASNAMDDSAIDLLNTEPSTVAGIAALLGYFADQEEAFFPHEVITDDGPAETFVACLVRHAADALGRMARPNFEDREDA